MQDFETTLRAMIATGQDFKARLGLNPEGRVLLRLESGTLAAGYVIVENAAIPAEIIAPTTQRVTIPGLDTFGPMGALT